MLLFDGRVLRNEQTCGEHRIEAGYVLHLIPRPPLGMDGKYIIVKRFKGIPFRVNVELTDLFKVVKEMILG
jgi:hypothetical protein